MYKILLTLSFFISINIFAQNIGFDTKDYKKLGVYDYWEASPFRLGKLKGNVGIIQNPFVKLDYNKKINSSKNIVGFQVSKYASNCYGIRIWLNTPLKLTPKTKYVHVLIHTPIKGRVMLIGLGKREDRKREKADIEQFMINSITPTKICEWFDAVFPIKGNENINIYSLVIIPYNESPHDLKRDFITYIDNIVVNNSNESRTLNFNSTNQFIKNSNDKYKINSISLNKQKIKNINNNYMPDTTFFIKKGDKINATINYYGKKAKCYLYLENNNYENINSINKNIKDYKFFEQVINEKNTLGEHEIEFPKCTMPNILEPGIYLMKYRIEHNNTEINKLLSKTVSIKVNIHTDSVTINNANRNGEIIASDGRKLNNIKIPFGKSFTVKINPAPGFYCSKITIRHGYNLTQAQIQNGIKQYKNENIIIKDNQYTIPVEYVDGNINIEGFFTEIKKSL